MSNFHQEECFCERGGGSVVDGSSLDPSMASLRRINHLISRESTMDIGVGDRHPNSGQGEGGKKCKKKISAKVEKNFAAALPLQIKFRPKFWTKGKVNLILKHCKLYKRKKNGAVWNFGPLSLQSMWKRFTQNFKRFSQIKQMRSDVERDNVETKIVGEPPMEIS